LIIEALIRNKKVEFIMNPSLYSADQIFLFNKEYAPVILFLVYFLYVLSMNEMANEAKQPLTIETTSICNRN
jgi:hypothetical protein